MKLRSGPRLTVLYRGNLHDTASLVGLAYSRAPIGVIAFIGEVTEDLKEYCETLNGWLLNKGLPAISIHPTLTQNNLDHIVESPYVDWGWSEKECKAAIKLAGLALPPSQIPA